MFRVALRVRAQVSEVGFAVGDARRDLPLFFCSCSVHKPHGSAADVVVPMVRLSRRRPTRSFCVFFLSAIESEGMAVGVVAAVVAAYFAVAVVDSGQSGELTGGWKEEG
jgi:hypothetical protein